MTDMNDIKGKFMSLLNTEEGKPKKEEKKELFQHVVCIFRITCYEDSDAAGEALRKGFMVLLDVSACDPVSAQRLKDFMKGVAYTMHAQMQVLKEDVVAYFPNDYQIQEFEE